MNRYAFVAASMALTLGTYLAAHAPAPADSRLTLRDIFELEWAADPFDLDDPRARSAMAAQP